MESHENAAILKWAKRIQEWDLPWTTGVYPAEMATFLGLAETHGAKSIVESGRGPDAYSTYVLGEFSKETGIPIVSVDFASIEEFHYGDDLKKYDKLTCVAGDSMKEVPKALASLPQPSAVLIDGPKAFMANRLSFALISAFPVRVIAHHNVETPSPWWQEFSTVYTGARHYEDLGLESESGWLSFREWELKNTGNYHVEDTARNLPGRTLEASSLGFAVIDDNQRASILSKVSNWKHRFMAKMLARKFRSLSSK